MNEEWIKLESDVNIPEDSYVDIILDTKSGLELNLLSQDDVGYKIIFERAHSYRRTYEALRLKTINEASEKYDNNIFEPMILIIENSKYLEWVSKESYDISAMIGMKHYVIVDSDMIVEVISESNPKIIKIGS